MQLFNDLNLSLDDILHKIGDNVKGSFGKFKNKIKEFPKYLDERLEEYKPIIKSAAIAALPSPLKISYLAGLYARNSYGGVKGKILGYVVIGIGAAVAVASGIMLGLNAIHSLSSSNHVQYLGSPNGYEAFVPHDQTINYHGHTDPIGDLILPNGTTLHNVIWDGQYSGMIVHNHNEITQLNSVWVSNNSWARPVDQLNGQPYVPLQDFYVIYDKVPVQQVTINGQTYYVIQANSINPANIAGFYTYDKWIPNFEVAINTPGTKAELLPQLSGNTTSLLPANSPIFYWLNVTGTVAYQTMVYQYGSDFIGGYLLQPPNGPIIPYGITSSPSGLAFLKFTAPKQVYNSYS